MIPPQLAGFAAKHAMKFALVAVVLAFLLLAYCSGRKDGKTGEVVEAQEREIEVQEQVGDANSTAADQRVEDTKKAAQQEKELNDAIKETSDPTRQRVLRGCIIMRQQGRDVSKISACRGYQSRPRAGIS